MDERDGERAPSDRSRRGEKLRKNTSCNKIRGLSPYYKYATKLAAYEEFSAKIKIKFKKLKRKPVKRDLRETMMNSQR